MPRWLDDLVGYNQILADDGTPARRRHILKFVGATVVDDGEATVVTTSGATTLAEYFLGAPDAALPNHRLPVESSTIGWNLATPNTFVAFVKPGSVLAALQFREQDVDVAQRDKLNVVNTASITLDFTDDALNEEVELRANFASFAARSVLANATNGIAVPAAFASTAARQALMSNAAGTALEWRAPTYADLDTASGLAVLARSVNSVGVMSPLLSGLSGQDGKSVIVNESLATLEWGRPKIIIHENVTTLHGVTNDLDFIDASPGVNWSISLTGRAQITGNVVGFASTSEPYVTYAATGNLSAERVTTSSASITIDTSVANQILFTRAALTGAITAAAGSNTTAFGAAASLSVLANATNGSAVPAYLQAAAAREHLRVNAAGTALEWGLLQLTDFPVIASDTFLANITISPAAPTAVSFTSVAGPGLVWDGSLNEFQVVGSTSIIVGANDVQRAALTGFVAAAQNVNATTSAEPIVSYSASANMTAERVLTTGTNNTVDVSVANQIRINWDGMQFRRNSGTLLTARRRVNVIEGPNISLTLNSDATDDENEVTVAVTGIVSSGAVTGAISHAAGGGASLFSGIRVNNSATTDRTNLNFTNGASLTAALTDDGPNDETEVRYDYVGTTSEINLASISGNQGTVNIGTLECGGCVNVSASADWSIEGFTAKPDGFWFILSANNANFVGTLFDDDSTATATDRMRLAHERNANAVALQAFIYYAESRWRVITAATDTLIGSDGVNPDNTLDMRDSSTNVVIGCGSSSSSVVITTGLGTGGFQVSAGHITLTSAQDNVSLVATDNIELSGDIVRITSGAALTSPGFLVILEAASSTHTVAAGDGMIWVQDSAPNSLMYTDDTNVDRVICGSILQVSGTVNAAALLTHTEAIEYTTTTTLNGISGGYRGRVIDVYSATSNNLAVNHASGSAAAADQLFLFNSANLGGASRRGMRFRHDGTVWREVARNG
jgi:hypothetical protein